MGGLRHENNRSTSKVTMTGTHTKLLYQSSAAQSRAVLLSLSFASYCIARFRTAVCKQLWPGTVEWHMAWQVNTLRKRVPGTRLTDTLCFLLSSNVSMNIWNWMQLTWMLQQFWHDNHALAVRFFASISICLQF